MYFVRDLRANRDMNKREKMLQKSAERGNVM
jgi:hypothetical protein